jgi:hypothetical protein
VTVTAVVVVTIALATIALVIGLLLRWLCEPWRAPEAPFDEGPSHFRPTLTGQCVRCGETRYQRDLTHVKGQGLVCDDGCLQTPAFARHVLTAQCVRCGERRLINELAQTPFGGPVCADGCPTEAA